MGNRWGNSGNSVRLSFGGSRITTDGDCSHEIKRWLLFGRKVMTNLDSIFKSRNITLQIKAHLVKAMVFLVVMYGCELDCEESLVLKNWCLWTVVFKKTLESPLDSKEIQLVLKEISPEHSLEGLMLKLQYWPPVAKNWLTAKDRDARKDWRQEEKGTIEDEMVAWHHQLDGHEFE